MNKTTAEVIAAQGLGWLVGEDDLLMTFAGATGADVVNLRAVADQPEFLASVLDFILMDDGFIQRFCESANLPYEAPMQARQFLPGGDLPNWT